MNDSLTILGLVILVCTLMVGSFALGRWDRRETYTPGPPDEVVQRIKAGRLDPDMVKAHADYVQSQVNESVRLVPRYPTQPANWGPNEPTYQFRDWSKFVVKLNDWPPPGKGSVGIAYFINREEQEFWYALMGRPVKRRDGMTAATCYQHPEVAQGRIETWHETDAEAYEWLVLHRQVIHKEEL